MCIRFWTRFKEICVCCWLAVWRFFCCRYIKCCETQESKEKTTDVEKKDKDPKNNLVELDGSKHEGREQNSEISKDEIKIDFAGTNGSKRSEHEVGGPSSASSEYEDRDSKSDLAVSSEKNHSEHEVSEQNSGNSEEEEKSTLPTDNTASHYTRQSIQVLTPLPSEFTNIFFEHFEKKLEEIGFNATVIDVDNFNADATCGDVILVICHCHSRLEGNVKNAVNGLNVELFERIFLIVLHAWNKNSNLVLPSKLQFQDHRLFKRFNNIVDIAFSNKDGIQDRETNTQDAFHALQRLKKDVAV